MNNNLFKGKKHQSFTLMITLCVQSDLGPNCMPTPFLVEQNCLCNRVGVFKIVIVINCNLITFSKEIVCNCN